MDNDYLDNYTEPVNEKEMIEDVDPVYYNHYVIIDDESNIIDYFSDAFRQPQENDICINEQGGYQFKLFPDGEENPPLLNDSGISLYKMINRLPVKRSNKEINAANIKIEKAFELQSEFTKLQKELADSDYKVIKCYEYDMAGLEYPYDKNELHNKREKIREQIRAIKLN